MKTRKQRIKRLAKEIKNLKKEYKETQQQFTFAMLNDENEQEEYLYWNYNEFEKVDALEKILWDKMCNIFEKLNKLKRIFRKEHIIASIRRGTPFEKIEQNINRTTFCGYHIKNDKPLKQHQMMFWQGNVKKEIKLALAQQTIDRIFASVVQ